MKTSDFDYELAEEYIAQTPLEPRDSSRLLVFDRATGEVQHVLFRDIDRFLAPGDILVLNQTRVIPARLHARKIPGGGKVELLLLHQEDSQTWEALVGGKGLKPGRKLQVEGTPPGSATLEAEILIDLGGPQRLVHFSRSLEPVLEEVGRMPLPPYIHTPLVDGERYQTVFARTPGSVAAPTAGLHFTPQLLERLQLQGIRTATVTLHVGLDTFAPVIEEDPRQHKIHTEWCQLSPEAAQAINRVNREGGKIVAVGTTSVRTLETAAQVAKRLTDQERGVRVAACEGPTRLFILPGHSFKATDAMVTNFHLPRSSLLMLVSAFAGRDKMMKLYEIAKKEGYRFYSFGDAMLIR